MQRANDWNLNGLTRHVRLWLGGSVALGAGAALFMVAQLSVLARVADDLAFQNHSLHAETGLFALAILLVVGRAVLQWLSGLMADEAAGRIVTALRNDLVQHLFRVGAVGMGSQPAGRVVATLTNGIDALEPYFAHYIPRAAAMVVVPILVLGTVLRLDGWSFLILVGAGPLIPVFMAFVGYRAQAIMDRQWTQLLLLSASFLDFLQGMTTLRLLGRARDAVTEVATMADRYRATTMSVMKVAFLTSAVLEFFASLSIALVAVVFGARLLSGTVAFYPAFLVLLLAPEYFMPLRAFSASYHARQNAVAAAERIGELFALPAVVPTIGLHPAPVSVATLCCEGISVRYVDGQDVIQDVQCRFTRNHLTVVVGESGAGKTTLMRVLLGVVAPSAGQVVARDELGHVIPQQWRSTIGWVPQRPRMVFGTVADNLRLGSPNADLSRLREVAEQAGALEFITALPKGFDTLIGERGITLSGGQIQRLALARVLLRNPSILILDEPTADLDPESERQVADALSRCVAGRIVIVVAHRAEMIARASHVLRVAHGRVFGPPRAVEDAA